ncbi:MAG TPA: hypothetical protein VFG69_13565 [Nannocystaceae bacterium]|nr:hypothetical protein [Nannocystaceae bacterium]
MSSDERETEGEGTAGAATPDAAKPDAAKADAPKPDAPKADAAKPDAPKPEAGGTVSAAELGAMGVEGDARERMDLPKWNRARVKRAPAKSDGPADTDAFQQGVRTAGRAAVRRGPLVVLGVLGLAGAIGLVIWLARRSDETRAVVTRPLAEAAALRARGHLVDMPAKPAPPPSDAELDATIERKIAEATAADGADEAKTLALLVRAGELVEAADFPGAEASYREFLERVGNGHALSFLAREGVAIALEGQGNLDGALAEIELLAGNVGDFYRDQALYQKGRLLERLDRKDDAVAAYKQYIAEYPLEQASMQKAAVRERLTELDPATVLPEEPAPSGLGDLLGP